MAKAPITFCTMFYIRPTKTACPEDVDARWAMPTLWRLLRAVADKNFRAAPAVSDLRGATPAVISRDVIAASS